jgi:hypothetical protein
MSDDCMAAEVVAASVLVDAPGPGVTVVGLSAQATPVGAAFRRADSQRQKIVALYGAHICLSLDQTLHGSACDVTKQNQRKAKEKESERALAASAPG